MSVLSWREEEQRDASPLAHRLKEIISKFFLNERNTYFLCLN
jgi:hypothetical protein